MWDTILDVIVKYWVNFLLAGFVAAATFFVRKYIKMNSAERKEAQKVYYEELQRNILQQNKEMIEEVVDQSKAHDDILQQQIDGVKNGLQEAQSGQAELKAGMLSMQGKNFKEDCRELLKPDHIITIDEWEDIVADHEAYNGLGGNHKGDQLFDMVKLKAEHTFLKD